MHLRSKGFKWLLYFLILGVPKAAQYDATSAIISAACEAAVTCVILVNNETRKSMVFVVEPALDATQKMYLSGLKSNPRAVTVSPPLSYSHMYANSVMNIRLKSLMGRWARSSRGGTVTHVRSPLVRPSGPGEVASASRHSCPGTTLWLRAFFVSPCSVQAQYTEA
jgi:hypothetical protein